MKKLVNISIDDVCPHPQSSIRVLDQCFKLIKIFPEIKFSLFVPMAYWRTIKPGTQSEFPYTISDDHDFCNTLLNLPERNFEIGYHGLFHGIPGRSDVDEFKFLNYKQSVEKFNLMFEISKKAGLYDKIKNIFRPPAWQITPEAMQAGKDLGIEIFALSNKPRHKKTYDSSDLKYNCVYYNVNPPYDDLKLFDKTEIVYHATVWDKNYLSNQNVEQLVSFLKKNKNEIEFSFMGAMI